jgi:pimeloyl-ACP methyl ester carboxylesterase
MALYRFDSRPWVSKIAQPTLVMIPTRDQLVPVAWQYDLASRIPGSTVRTLDRARHEVVWTHPEEIAEALRQFFGSARVGTLDRQAP